MLTDTMQLPSTAFREYGIGRVTYFLTPTHSRRQFVFNQRYTQEAIKGVQNEGVSPHRDGLLGGRRTTTPVKQEELKRNY